MRRIQKGTVDIGMKINSILLASALLLSAFSSDASAQIVSSGQEAPIYLGQAAQPAPPYPPAAPTPPMQDVMRLMASSGSYLGVGVRDVDDERKKALNLKEERGAEITSIQEDSPASRAGLKNGDVVLDYAGTRVESMEQFIRMVRETPAGREVKIGVTRAGNLTTVTAKPESGQSRLSRTLRIAPMPQIDVRSWMGSLDSPRAVMYWKNSSLGVEAESLDNQLADFFGVKQGVLIRSVGKETPAEKAGVKAGDVIVRVEDKIVGSPREVTTAVRSARASGKTVILSLVRDKKEVVLKVVFDEEPPAAAPRSRTIQNKFQD